MALWVAHFKWPGSQKKKTWCCSNFSQSGVPQNGRPHTGVASHTRTTAMVVSVRRCATGSALATRLRARAFAKSAESEHLLVLLVLHCKSDTSPASSVSAFRILAGRT